MFKVIVCQNTNGVIGNNGKLLYHIKNDMHNFSTITNGSVVVMGRKTFESIPNPPLKNRINIILTNDINFNIDASLENVIIAHSIEEVVDICATLYIDKEWFIIGGASVYKEFNELGLVDTIYLTTVNDKTDGDTKFFEIDSEKWCVFYESLAQKDENGLEFRFSILKKKE